MWKVNLCKSKVFGIGMGDIDIARLASILYCEPASFPFSYLGLPIGANMKLTRNWNPIVEKFRAKLSLLEARSLSFGGKLTLVKSVLSSFPLYYFSNFKAPRKIIKLLKDWKRLPRRGKEMNELEGLETVMVGTNLSIYDDMWVWKGSSSGLFSISSLRGLMTLNLSANGSMDDFQWVCGEIPVVSSRTSWPLIEKTIITRFDAESKKKKGEGESCS
uniref:Uncharacterized protein n=1 Tax=Lactuca sativa TaxID=4236 RepID=A0A9R1VQQ4_LACSA|nr:hypothetical protein LSAT_V11C400163940 [Lactuca sativa]